MAGGPWRIREVQSAARPAAERPVQAAAGTAPRHESAIVLGYVIAVALTLAVLLALLERGW
jgi:hypothetical protein